MKIAYINIEDLTKSGGGKVHFWAISRCLVALGHQIYIFSPRYSERKIIYPKSIIGISWKVFGKNALGLFLFELILLISLPVKIFRYKLNVLLIRGGGVSLIMGLVIILARFFGLRVVLECNGVSWHEAKSRKKSNIFYLFTLFGSWQQAATVNAIIGVTPSICDEYRNICKNRNKEVFAISNGTYVSNFDLGKRDKYRKELGIPSGKICIIMPSSFAPWHGHRELILALNMLSESELQNILCYLPGDGECFEETKRLINSLKLNNKIILPGKLDQLEVVRYLLASDIGLLITTDNNRIKSPGSPLKLFEYLAAGLFVIAPNDNYNGPLIRYYNCGWLINDIATDNLLDMLKNLNSIDYSFYRENNHNIACENFDWYMVAKRVESVLKGNVPIVEEWIENHNQHSI